MNSFPGGVAVTDLEVYDTAACDGRVGGSPHLHTASSEAYIVIAGTGAVHTLSAQGYAEHSLEPGDTLWFTPGTIHRLINGGGLRLLVVMSNAGLPEAGDAVFTFPAHVLDDPDAYRAAATLPDGPDIAQAVQVRRDLAVEGFLALQRGGAEALAAFHTQAARLVGGRIARWQKIWERSVAAPAAATRDQLTALAAGEPGALGAASVTRAVREPGERAWGMCGRLRTWSEDVR
ncbi:cupin domain-containing protein [Microbacterium protaetiae]|uniref:Cupin domain-containing protein n=1 Tax=Microbacterium protaetiae TaxID=2509458 RepID=A0A4V0YD09_9MICO|nr:cupin domain-containing protein [Microbacterium protaetiae]QAY59071.1 cupin domain-containing protein [Microbacterium protaetiae]